MAFCSVNKICNHVKINFFLSFGLILDNLLFVIGNGIEFVFFMVLLLHFIILTLSSCFSTII